MQYQVVSDSATQVQTGCIVVTLDQSGKLSDSAQAINSATGGFLQARIDAKDIKGNVGDTLLLLGVSGISAERVLLVGTGKDEISAFNAGKIVTAIASGIAKIPGTVAVSIADLASECMPEAWWAEQMMLALHSAQYRFTATKPAKEEPAKAEKLIWIGSDVGAALERGDAIGMGTDYAKDLGNMPPNICTPTYLAEQAEAIAADGSMTCKVYDEKELEAMGAGSFYSVSKGSSEPGKIIILQYLGAADKNAAPHMLVGKGITFDTGGISLKPGPKMDEMKYDMCGAASVLGTMKTIQALKPAINVVAIVTSAENMPSGHASKPGDVVTSLSGLTIEILNTDAEGRLVLCDALTLGIRDYQPASVVDIATLTGACMAALGKVNSGLFTTDEGLATELMTASGYSRDRIWRLPLEEDYQAGLDSNFADIANIGGPLAGATTAACFLSRFTEGTRWAHLDIAGPAWGGDGTTKNSTGRPVPLLSTYLLNKES
ncbi:MAG: leucyl aminopeptidase [Thalassolituus sp.]|uniref:leucyl aminopeptidase n=1 Tax=Thalassolituus sp. TaxID=2030822 RepID=UPI0039826A16